MPGVLLHSQHHPLGARPWLSADAYMEVGVQRIGLQEGTFAGGRAGPRAYSLSFSLHACTHTHTHTVCVCVCACISVYLYENLNILLMCVCVQTLTCTGKYSRTQVDPLSLFSLCLPLYARTRALSLSPSLSSHSLTPALPVTLSSASLCVPFE